MSRLFDSSSRFDIEAFSSLFFRRAELPLNACFDCIRPRHSRYRTVVDVVLLPVNFRRSIHRVDPNRTRMPPQLLGQTRFLRSDLL